MTKTSLQIGDVVNPFSVKVIDSCKLPWESEPEVYHLILQQI